MGRVRVKTTRFKYKEQCGRLKQQVIKRINDQTMTAKIIKELTVMKDSSEI